MMRSSLSLFTSLLTLSASLVSAITVPPSGAIIVRQTGTKTGEFKTVSDAVRAAGVTGTNAAVIFIYPGTYTEQVNITRPGKLDIYGYSSQDSTYAGNQVTITYDLNIKTAGSDDVSGTLRVHKDDFSLRNVNVQNTYGSPASHVQAIALSGYGSRQQYLGCSFIGVQDTILTQTGTQFYSGCLIQGAVDYIFGQYSSAWFYRSHIQSIGSGSITASGRFSNDAGVYVFDSCWVELAPNAVSGTSGQVYLGRPWAAYARVIFQNSSLGAQINSLGWNTWPSSTPDTSKVVFAEFNNNGAGSSRTGRATFSQALTKAWSISDVLGSNYASWCDAKFLQ